MNNAWCSGVVAGVAARNLHQFPAARRPVHTSRPCLHTADTLTIPRLPTKLNPPPGFSRMPDDPASTSKPSANLFPSPRLPPRHDARDIN
ncbi:hypothetical protein E2C01_067884 [Portunus trituberculatus]|uniref:Uncharacterized protein n=1 Tax=Portunus trituberculatus TaxID=210409 RepID=A0A5B7HL14_PORTR|nr:hypothetical protein [Portunus trituberculatus]